MSGEDEVKSLSNQAEKILDGHAEHHDAHPPGNTHRTGQEAGIPHVHASIEVAAVLAELAKAHAMVELANAIRESTFGADVVAPGLRPI